MKIQILPKTIVIRNIGREWPANWRERKAILVGKQGNLQHQGGEHPIFKTIHTKGILSKNVYKHKFGTNSVSTLTKHTGP